MRLNNESYTSIWMNKEDDILHIIDQRKLPFRLEIEDLKTSEDVFYAIKDMHLRGAPLIGVAAAYAMYFSCLELGDSINVSRLEKEAKRIKSARPTAVNLSFAVDRILGKIKNEPCEKWTATALNVAHSLRLEEIDCSRKIGEYGLQIIEEISKRKKGECVHILTHCNAGWLACVDYGTATSPIYLAAKKGIDVHVWVDETRPRNQGARLTAYELNEEQIPHTLICDNTGGHLMQHGMVDMVIVGSDRTTANGDVANKIGTYLKALAAFDNKVPFYVALPISTIDRTIYDGIKEIPIEERDEKEVNHIEGLLNNRIVEVALSYQNCASRNYGFDVTPARLITSLITDKGICEANEKEIQKLFL